MTRATLVEVFAASPFGGATVAVVHGDPGDRAQRVAAGLGCAATAFLLPPRRDDCGARARVFTPRRELPLSVGAALAVAEALGGESLSLELGVTRTDVTREAPGRWSASLARPVLGAIPLHDRALAAAAVGLDEGELASGLPAVSASCGVPLLVLPLRSPEALARAAAQPAAWQRLVEKAKPFGAALVVPAAEGELAMRFVLPGAADDLAAGVACAAAAAWLVREGVRPATARQVMRFALRDGARCAAVAVTVDGAGDRDGAVRVAGDVAAAGEATLRG